MAYCSCFTTTSGAWPRQGESAIDHIGFDLGKVNSQLCIITAEGELIERRISTSRDSLTKLLGSRPPALILIEAATESEWVARHLESLGHELVVADPNFAPMYATRSRRVKTDKRDARTLAEASRLGAYRPAHRTSDQQRHIRAQLAVREALVRTRAKYIALSRAMQRRDGFLMPNRRVPTWDWCPPSTALASDNNEGGSTRPAPTAPATCWSKLAGQYCVAAVPPPLTYINGPRLFVNGAEPRLP